MKIKKVFYLIIFLLALFMVAKVGYSFQSGYFYSLNYAQVNQQTLTSPWFQWKHQLIQTIRQWWPHPTESFFYVDPETVQRLNRARLERKMMYTAV